MRLSILPGILSIFIPGLGQLFKGELGKGVALFIAVTVIPVTFVFVFGFSGILWGDTLYGAAGLFGFLLWIYNVYDAFQPKEKSKEQNI
jgi:TM2 domain-containing membrane protein YozV